MKPHTVVETENIEAVGEMYCGEHRCYILSDVTSSYAAYG